MSQQPGANSAAGRGKKRKLKPSKPLLEQLPADVPAAAAADGAGLQHKKHKRRQQQQQPQQQQHDGDQQEQQPDALSAGNSKFARALGSTDFHTREQGLAALSRWLLHRPSTTELDMLKLWKGIYFCFWHSDKEPVQEDLAERLSGLIPRMQPSMAVLYWAAMLSTLRSEWFALDRHRLNKFLMLVRKFVAAVLTRLAAADWDVPTIQAFTSNLPLVGCLVPAGQTGRSLGLSYHLADVWLPELRGVVAAAAAGSSRAPPPASLQALLEPFVVVMQQSGEAALVNRVRESVFEGLAQDLAAAAAAGVAAGSSSDDSDDDDGSSWAYCQLLDVQQYASLLFDRGAEQGVRARNREALYGVSKDLERVAGKRRKAAAAAAATVAGGSQQQPKNNNQRKQQRQGEAVAPQQQQQQPGDKKAKKQKQPQQPQQQQEQEQAVPTQNGIAEPRSSSAKKRSKHAQQQQPAAQEPGVPAAAPAAAAAAAVTPNGSAHKQHKKQRRQSAAAAAAAGGSTGGGAAGSPRSPRSPRSHSRPRGVKIDLKKNLYFEHGAPAAAAAAATPPKAPTPLKSALKSAAVALDASGRPATAPGGGSRLVVTPSSVPRLRASEFF